MGRKLSWAVASFVLISLLAATAARATTADWTIYSGGPILTMHGEEPELVEAVAIRNGRIVATGSKQDVEGEAGRNAAHVDLKGRAMLPGFIDAHGHVSLLGRFGMMADLSGPPLGNVTTIDRLQEVLLAFAKEHPQRAIAGRGYDDAALESGQHPTRQDLDVVSIARPIAITHVSGHLAVANSAMLTLAGIGPDTPDPEGGKIRREADGKTPNGVLEEAAMRGVFGALMPRDPETEVDAIFAGLEEYVSNGITTAQDGGVAPMQWAAYKAASKRGLPIDVALLMLGMYDMPEGIRAQIGKGYEGRVRIAGLKFVLDGSPQGRTAWLSKPYHIVPDGKPADYRGYPAMNVALFDAKLAEAASNGWQVFTHVNGDAAAGQLIASVRKAGLAGRRTVAIHNQVVREDQLMEMRGLDIQPSFFANHTYFWGDWHRDVVLGGKRADFISPQATAWRLGLTPTAHNDAPIVPPDMMRLVWSSVNRRTLSGDILGPKERIPAYRALQQVTINAAWQIHEEAEKGSIAPGKQADFVILDRNPLGTGPEGIADIKVIATINDGEIVYGSLESE